MDPIVYLLLTSILLPELQFTSFVDHRQLVDCTYIVGELDVFLGNINADTTDENSIMNPYGGHGSDEAYYSIFGDGGPYKGLNGVFSPFNRFCEAPPRIMKDSVFVAYLTENELLSPRVSTYVLIGYLYDKVKRLK